MNSPIEVDNHLKKIIAYQVPDINLLDKFHRQCKQYQSEKGFKVQYEVKQERTLEQLKNDPLLPNGVFNYEADGNLIDVNIVEWLHQQKYLIYETIKNISNLTDPDDIDDDNRYAELKLFRDMSQTAKSILDCLFFIEKEIYQLAFYSLSDVICDMQRIFYDKLKLEALKYFTIEKAKTEKQKARETAIEKSRKIFFDEMQKLMEQAGGCVQKAATLYYESHIITQNEKFKRKYGMPKGWREKAKKARVNAIRKDFYVVKKVFS